MKLFASLALGLAACALHAQTTYTYNDLGDVNAAWAFDPTSYYAPATIARPFGVGQDFALQDASIEASIASEIHLRMFIYDWNADSHNYHTIGAPIFESTIQTFVPGDSLLTFDVPNIYFRKNSDYILVFSGQGLARTGQAGIGGIDSGGPEFRTSTYRDGNVAFNDLSKWGNPDADNYWNPYVPSLAIKLDFGTPVPEPSILLLLLPGILLIKIRSQVSGKSTGDPAKGTLP